eukprot:70984-Hanusia_phi.AAC.1
MTLLQLPSELKKEILMNLGHHRGDDLKSRISYTPLPKKAAASRKWCRENFRLRTPAASYSDETAGPGQLTLTASKLQRVQRSGSFESREKF